MEVLTKEFLKSGRKGTAVNGVALIKDYTIQLTKTGSEYVTGTLMSGETISFKAWSNSSAFTQLKANDFSNVPSLILGSFDEYNGVVSIIVSNVTAVEGFTLDQFLPVKYNADAYFKGLRGICEKVVSEKGLVFLDTILFKNDEVVKRFCIEFAAKSHHDNCKSGLLAHTYKVVSNTVFLMSQYSGLVQNSQDIKDLLVIGAVLHDLGKIWEMNLGTYQPCSVVTHRYLGAEYIGRYKDKLVESYNIDWYYNLISIFLQHHGEFDDDCRSVYAQIIHTADLLDADFTTLASAIESAVDKRIKFRDKYLSF